MLLGGDLPAQLDDAGGRHDRQRHGRDRDRDANRLGTEAEVTEAEVQEHASGHSILRSKDVTGAMRQGIRQLQAKLPGDDQIDGDLKIAGPSRFIGGHRLAADHPEGDFRRLRPWARGSTPTPISAGPDERR